MLSRFLTLREQLILGGLGVAILVGAGTLVWLRSNEEKPATAARDIPALNLPASRSVPAAAPVPAAPSAPAAITPDASPAMPPPSPQRIAVAVQGAVLRPGMYYFDAGQRVNDLLLAAGGARQHADLSDINLSAHLIDGTTLIVPSRPDAEADPPRGRARDDAIHFATRPPNPPPYTISGWTPQQAAAQPSLPQPSNAAGDTRESAPPAGRINLNTATQSELESLPGIGPAFAGRIIAFREQQRFERIEDLKLVTGIGEKRFAALKDLVTVD